MMRAKKETKMSRNGGKRLGHKLKSCIAVALSTVLVCTSLNQVQAEGETKKVPVTGDADEAEFVRNPDGAVILLDFEPLTEAEAHITLDEKGTLTDVLAKLPSELKAYADAYVLETEEETTTEETSEEETTEETEEVSEMETATATEGVSEEEPEGSSKEEVPGETEESSATEPEGSSTTETVTEPESPSTTETVTEPESPSTTETVTESEGASTTETVTEPESSSAAEPESPSTVETPTAPAGSFEGGPFVEPEGVDGTTESGSTSAQEITKAVPVPGMLTAALKNIRQELVVTTNWVSLRKILAEAQTIPMPEVVEPSSVSEALAEESYITQSSSSQNNPEESEESSTPATVAGEENSSLEGTTETAKEPSEDESPAEPEDASASGAPETTEADSTVETETETETVTETVPESSKEREVFRQELMVPVTWECTEDYENTDLKTYTFKAVWDQTAYFYDEELTPTIEVRVVRRKAGGILVSTQEELADALAEGEPKILLENDISLTMTLTVPAFADTALDGQGFSLRRGEDENGTFMGPMIYLGGEDYTEDIYGMLTLSNIHIDGQTAGNYA